MAAGQISIPEKKKSDTLLVLHYDGINHHRKSKEWLCYSGFSRPYPIPVNSVVRSGDFLALRQ